jgi:hypothetical protein
MLFRIIIAEYSENHKKLQYPLWINADYFNLKERSV